MRNETPTKTHSEVTIENDTNYRQECLDPLEYTCIVTLLKEVAPKHNCVFGSYPPLADDQMDIKAAEKVLNGNVKKRKLFYADGKYTLGIEKTKEPVRVGNIYFAFESDMEQYLKDLNHSDWYCIGRATVGDDGTYNYECVSRGYADLEAAGENAKELSKDLAEGNE